MSRFEKGNVITGAAASPDVRNREREAHARAAIKGWKYAAVLCAVVATILALAAQSYRAIGRELTDAALSRRAAVAQLAAITLTEKFERLVDLAVSLSTRVRFRQLIADGQWAEAIGILRAIPSDFPFVDWLVVLDTGGMVMGDVPERRELRGASFADQEWYRSFSRSWKPYVSAVYQRPGTPQTDVFAVVAPIRREDGAVAGILSLQMRLDSYFEWIKAVEAGPGGYAYFIDQKGRVAFHSGVAPPRKIVDLQQVPVVDRVLRGEHGIATVRDPGDGEELVSAYAAIPKFGWGVIVQQPARTAFAARDQQLARLLFAYGLTVLSLAVGAYLASRIVVERSRAREDRRLSAALERGVVERTAQLEASNREIEESREQFRAVAETANDAIVSADVHGNIIYFNRAAERILGYPEQETLGRPLTLLMPDRFHAAHRAELRRFLATGRSRIIEKTQRLVGRRKNGSEFPMEVSVAHWATAKGVFFTAILRDITARKKAEEALKRSNKDLQAANQELEGFSYSVSHDLRAPLRAVSGFCKLLLEDHGEQLNAESRRKIDIIHNEAQRLGVLIDELLAFSRLGRQAMQVSEVDMTELARAAFKGLSVENMGSNTEFHLDVLPTTKGDRLLLGQVWANLLSNAVKFSSKREHPVVEVSAIAGDKEDIYFVRDNGAGFDPRYQSKLFGVFQRLHNVAEFPGTGVGLALVQRIVARHGGRAWAESKLNEGATFFFSLPKDAAGG